MNYEEAIAYVAGLQGRGWRLGLDRMEEFARRLDLAGSLGDGSKPKFIHIAGTNGKGSTTALVESVLRAMGFRTGGYFSPYVYDFRERVQLNGQRIAKFRLAELASKLRPIADQMSETDFGGITEFEFKTALGFQFWKEEQCDWVACEVGLGGRLDATNILMPECSVITSIGLDHVNILGHTYRQIASEKAGIIKAGRPCVIGLMNDEARKAIRSKAIEVGSPLIEFGRDFRVLPKGERFEAVVLDRKFSDLHCGLRGPVQRQNAAVAIAAVISAGLNLSGDEVRLGLQNAYAPGRFEVKKYQGRTIILDGAHNGQAAQVLADSLQSEFPGQEVVLITNMIEGHEPEAVYSPLVSTVKSVHIAPIDFYRAHDPAAFAKLLTGVFSQITSHASLNEAVDDALADTEDGGIILVTGSFYLVGDVGRTLFPELTD